MRGYLALLGVVAAILTVMTFTVPDLPAFQSPALARMMLWHLPCAISCTIWLLWACICALMLLSKGGSIWGHRMNAAIELTLLLGVLTLATGIVFSKVQWGDWWSWDPRQTSFLFAMLIVAAYFGLRGSIQESSQRFRVCAVYVAAATLPLLFLIFVFPRLKTVITLHPDVVRQGGMSSDYGGLFFGMLIVLFAIHIVMYRANIRLELLSERLENERLDMGGNSAADRVVRPVSLSDED